MNAFTSWLKNTEDSITYSIRAGFPDFFQEVKFSGGKVALKDSVCGCLGASLVVVVVVVVVGGGGGG